MRKLGCRLYLRSKVQLEPEKWFQQLAGQSILSCMNSHHMRIDVKILFVNLTHLAKTIGETIHAPGSPSIGHRIWPPVEKQK